MAGERARRAELDVLLEEAVRLSFHAITGVRWTPTDAGAVVGIGGLGDEVPNIIRGKDEPLPSEGSEDHVGPER